MTAPYFREPRPKQWRKLSPQMQGVFRDWYRQTIAARGKLPTAREVNQVLRILARYR